jgi:renalase
MKKIAIIGAGLSGLSAAYLLKNYAEITVFEKARGVSGRMSTRRSEPYFFDHGAQYFTARTKAFQDFIAPLINQGIIERWNPSYVKFDGNKIIERKNWGEEEPRYVGTPGMSEISKFLAKELNVKINKKIISINYKGKWQLVDNQGTEYSGFDWVICSAPSLQTVELMPKSFLYYNDIKNIQMSPCFALMLGFKQDIPLKFNAAHVINSELSWIAVNNHKPKRLKDFTLIIHSSKEYAEEHINDSNEEVMQDLILETSRIIGCDVSLADYKIVHRWLYANNYKKDHINNIIYIDQKNQLASCGDWCLNGRVEGAFTSAYNLALKIKESIL